MNNINFMTLALVLLFVFPLIIGFLSPMNRNKMAQTICSFLDSVEFVIALVLACVFISKTFSAGTTTKGHYILKKLYEVIPENFRLIIESQQMIAFLLCLPVVFLIFLMVLRLLTTPIYRFSVEFLPSVICPNNKNGLGARITGTLCKLPQSIVYLMVAIFALNIFNYFSYNPMLQSQMNSSRIYKALQENVVNPVMKGSWALKIPVLLNDSFAKNENGSKTENKGPIGIIENLTNNKIKVIEYFNGVTLEEAVKSNSEIDKTAFEITKKQATSKEKAYVIYKWIVDKLEYDNAKAERLSTNSKGMSSGAIPAFNTRKGVCFDYSALYVAMCRATGLKVRLVTGLGYSGSAWGDHAWNEVYSEEEQRWMNVDTTFGESVNFFDKKGFKQEHMYPEIQGEW